FSSCDHELTVSAVLLVAAELLDGPTEPEYIRTAEMFCGTMMGSFRPSDIPEDT
ncbi:hypothetical protein GOODEAATRI_032275, partial [Goodea atripinnis]